MAQPHRPAHGSGHRDSSPINPANAIELLNSFG